MLPLGTALPQFELPDTVSGESFNSQSLSGKVTLVTLICNHCPFVVHLKTKLSQLAREYTERGVAVVAISSNDIETHPADGPDEMAVDAKQQGYCFPYLYDETQDVAKAFRAACTPEFYVFDRAGKLAYRGQFDDSRPSNGKPATGADVSAALDALLTGSAPSSDQKPSIGCNVKWKRGAVPDYA
jgi:thiol-disulfide isomerase/thioredoxin